MIIFTKILMMTNIFMTMSALNPVKMSFLVLTFSSILFLTLNNTSGMSWFPLIFFLLFMGGIMIMFLILSSLMPNEKSMKQKFSLNISIILTIIFLNFNSFSPNLTGEAGLKWSMSSNMSMEILVLLILGYFFGFIFLISNNKSSMRSST